jgi:hypothetical protein
MKHFRRVISKAFPAAEELTIPAAPFVGGAPLTAIAVRAHWTPLMMPVLAAWVALGDMPSSALWPFVPVVAADRTVALYLRIRRH